MSRAIAIVCAICIAACGRLNFGVANDPTGDGGLDDAGDGSTGRPNIAFTTRQVYRGDFGGVAVADATCANDATAAGLPGTFVALLSTSTMNARDRLAGSRGWVSTSGQPIADQVGDVFSNGRALGVLSHDAAGAGLGGSQVTVWTASDVDGVLDVMGSCGDWTSPTGGAITGFYTRSAPFMMSTVVLPCSQNAHIYCFEVGNVAVVEPKPIVGRIAFLSAAPASTASGITAFDAQCQSDATSAGIPGSYVAAVATTTGSIASRFAMTTPWRRVDGTAVSRDAANMFDSALLVSTVNQQADGNYLSGISSRSIRTGAANPTTVGTATSTCNDWSTSSGTGTFYGVPLEINKNDFWGNANADCSLAFYLLCLEQ